ncbi:uncharacterized protein P174DRAFT_430919 [Aspergillus novofumigatus IBT 16806]|uniref:LysM domain-containing protein n=1 Tax=Aspergillus novofumigatus (strain IBT 16806) TaxID=1392255 RepID=A0A2I1C8K0_ASPN1|nr:uncharacterized protein P174DRAFT_430919 [Aspergillus novofumigatus IBT 16806]PKX93947.1 hypothetical protein P174DRAFT_430919 [Aspergillus novofumigatus IBT 16806]
MRPMYTTNATSLPTSLLLALGTSINCSAYAEYIYPWRNTSTINTCYVVATFYDVHCYYYNPITSTPTTSTQPATITGPNDVPTPLPIQLLQHHHRQWHRATDFYSWSPSLNGDCSGLYLDYYVCVGLVSGSTVALTSTTRATTTSTTGTGGAVVTPTPTQAGMVSGCTKFYLVESSDGCYDIAAAEGITLSNPFSWNPALNGGLFWTVA